MCDKAISQLLVELRPNVIAFVDAFDIPDNVLNSTLGFDSSKKKNLSSLIISFSRHDGNVYEALYAGAVRSKLNIEQVRETSLFIFHNVPFYSLSVATNIFVHTLTSSSSSFAMPPFPRSSKNAKRMKSIDQENFTIHFYS